MCGIVAIVDWKKPLPPEAIERATASLRHRGPDGTQIWRSEDRRAGLGHTRLSIIDLATGTQPIANEDGSLRLVANGEFYDFERIQRELAARGHQLRTRSDSEIALHLYEEAGVECLGQLRGEFAFAIWEEAHGRLFAARDRFGIKPLYYAEAHGTLFLASEVKALAAAGVPMAWDHEAVAQNLYSSLVGGNTLYRGVRQVPPGHYLVAQQGSLRVAPYWDLNYPFSSAGAPAKYSDDEWIEGLRQQTEDAVRLRMRADVPVGCLLSGGLDSSATLGIARTFAPGPLEAFTIAFDHAGYDESPIARESAAQMGANFHPIRVTNADFAAVFPDVVWHMEGFCYNAHTSARFLLSRAVRDAGVKVVLAGEGADEIAAGYRFFQETLGTPGQALSWPDEVTRVLTTARPTAGQVAAIAPLLQTAAQSLNFPRFFFDHRAGRMAAAQGLFSPAFVQELAQRDPAYLFFRQFDVAAQLAGRDSVKQAFYLWMKSSFANYILSGERLDMAHGVEQRLPFLDHKLFEFAREIPPALFRREEREKWILRQAMKPFVTARVYGARKQPFVAPPTVLQEGSAMFTLAQDRLRSTMAAVPFFDRQATIGFLDRLVLLNPTERAGFDPLVLLLLSCDILQERYRLSSP